MDDRQRDVPSTRPSPPVDRVPAPPPRPGSSALAGLVEAILALHQLNEGGRYSGLGHPKTKSCAGCGTGNEWPCATVRLIAEVTGSQVPEPVMTDGFAPFHPSWCHVCDPDSDGGDGVIRLD